MITIIIHKDKITVLFPFDQNFVNIVRELPGARWNKKDTVWEFPVTIETYKNLLQTFGANCVIQFKGGVNVPRGTWVTYDQLSFKTTPRQHQYNALNFIKDRFNTNQLDYSFLKKGVALFAEMGTGKTKIVIDTIGAMNQAGLLNSSVIIAPLSIIDVWIEEFSKHANYQYLIYELLGSKIQKLRYIEHYKESNHNLKILLINPEGIDSVSGFLHTEKFDIAIIDESTMIKNHRAQRSKNVKKINSQYKIIASGNPIPKSLDEIFSQYEFIDSGVYGTNYYKFRDKYFYTDEYNRIHGFKNNNLEKEFYGKLHSLAFIVRKKDCLDLPEQIFEVRYCKFDTEQEIL